MQITHLKRFPVSGYTMPCVSPRVCQVSPTSNDLTENDCHIWTFHLSKPQDQYISILKKLLVLPTPDKGQVKKSPVVGVHTFNPSTQETEASGSL